MSDQEDASNLMGMSELDVLKNRARMMGIEFSNNIKTETLRERINAKLAGEEVKAEEEAETLPLTDAMTGEPIVYKSLRQHCQDEAMKLVRVRVTCMDPKKKDLPGEILTVANEYIGTVKKFVPYGIEAGWHIPHCILEFMQERQFLNLTTRKTRQAGGQEIVQPTWAKEYAIEIMPPLTEEELHNLALTQAAAGSVEA